MSEETLQEQGRREALEKIERMTRACRISELLDKMHAINRIAYAALSPAPATDQQEARRIAVDLLEGYGPETMVGVVCRALLEK